MRRLILTNIIGKPFTKIVRKINDCNKTNYRNLVVANGFMTSIIGQNSYPNHQQQHQHLHNHQQPQRQSQNHLPHPQELSNFHG